MSCADFCIDMGADEPNDFGSGSTVKARKPHTCCECKRTIAVSEVYSRYAGKCDGAMFTSKTCAECADIRQALVCGSYYFGQLWESVEEQVFPWFQIDCMVDIETVEARMKLWTAWRAWKGGR